jgi:Flp pilus assembly protein TadB
MNTRFRLDDRGAPPEGRATGFLTKVIAFAAAAILLVVGAMFSLILVAVVTVVALLIFGYVWWNTRELRRQLRERPPGGRVIEGEAVRHEDE